MFYISSIKGNKLGVTDTKDDVEEFYTKEELADFFFNHRIKISGFTYTGSKFSIEVKSKSLIHLESLSNGDVFKLNGVLCMRVGETGTRDFDIFLNNEIKKLRRKDLLANKYKVEVVGASENNKLELAKQYIKLKPTSQLSCWLSNKYGI